MELIKALLIGTGVYAVLQWTDRVPSNLEVALLAALWGVAVGLVFWRIDRRRKRQPPRSLGFRSLGPRSANQGGLGQTGKEKP